MMKKVALGLGITFLVGAVIFGVGNMIGMLKVGGNKISDYAQSQVPISAKIELLDQKLNDLGPKIEDAKRVVASQEVKVNRLGKDVKETEIALNMQKDTIYAMRDDLARNEKQYVYAGETFSHEEVQTDLEKRFSRYTAAKGALDQQKELLKVRQRVLKANQQAYSNLIDSKEKLEIMIEKLRARQETIKAKQIENMQTVDDSPTGDINKLYEEIDEELAVEERLIEMEGDDVGEIQLKKAEQKNLLEEIDAMRNKDATNGKNNELIKTEL